MALVERQLRVTFIKASGSFANGSNKLVLTGHRVSARIEKVGGPSKNLSEIAIYGMRLDIMNDLSTLGMVVRQVPNDTVTLEAGDGTNFSLVFSGNIIAAAADFSAAPEVPFRVSAQAGAYHAVARATPMTFPGRQSVFAIMQQIATAMGLPFENHVQQDMFITDAYLPWTLWVNMSQLAWAAQVGAMIDDGTVVVYPLDGPRKDPIITIGPPPIGNMIGYPTYISQGILVRNLYDPRIRFHSQIELKGSSIPQANGKWLVASMDHYLESLMPGGKWESTMICYNPVFGFVQPQGSL